MKKILIFVSILLAIPILMYITGIFISETHTATVSREISARHSEVWSAVTDIAGKTAWDPSVERVEILSDTGDVLKWREYFTDNEAFTYEEVSRTDSTEWIVRMADENLPFGGTWTYRFEPSEKGTQVTITEDGEIYNPFFRVISKLFIGYEDTMRTYLDNLEEHFSSSVQ